MRLHELAFAAVREGLAAGEFTSRDLVDSALERMERVEPVVNAFVSVRDRDELLAEADAADSRRARGEDHPLLGVPVAVKDNIVTAGLATTAGSRILEGYVPPYDATAVARLRAAGAVIVGKTNLDEFAMGSSTETSAHGPVRNPWDRTRVPGGSSGGSAAAVAAGEVPLALGSDTGGSVRQPASFCGVVGAKPTYGRVSRYGLIAFASSLDQIGVFSRDVEGAAALLTVIAGEDPRDGTTAAEPVPDLTAGADGAGEGLSGLRIGVPAEYFAKGLDPEVERPVRKAMVALEGLGAEFIDVSIPHLRYGIPAYYLVADAEASSNLARYDGVKYGLRSTGASDIEDLYLSSRSEGFGDEVKRRIMLGTYALSAGYYDDYYLKAQQVRTLISRDFARAFDAVDAIVSPTSPTTAFGLGERADDPIAMYLSDVYTVPANLAGVAAISVPCGTGAEGLPVGMQITVDKFREQVMFRVARAYERAAGFPPPPVL
jgi:aspartyl-tRNA(Asn)/glutamyl-tRNA(Gln) amidotransferase subunit A